MKKKFTATLIALLVLVLLVSGTAFAAPKADKDEVNSITQGEVVYRAGHYLEGQTIPLGYDIFGYNYQAHLFKGSYANTYLGVAGYPPYTGDDEAYLAEYPEVEGFWYWQYREWQISMKWNDAWIANTDKDLDGILDRHYGFESYIGSGAWEYYKEWFYDENGGLLYSSSCKIVAVPEGSELVDGIWYTEDGEEIGYEIWGQFAVIQEQIDHENTYKSPIRAGLGNW